MIKQDGVKKGGATFRSSLHLTAHPHAFRLLYIMYLPSSKVTAVAPLSSVSLFPYVMRWIECKGGTGDKLSP